MKLLRILLAALLLGGGVPALMHPAQAQGQAASVNPRALSVQEQQLLQQLREVDGRTSIPDPQSQRLIQPAGKDWREFHQGPMLIVGAISVLGITVLSLLFFVLRGRIRIDGGRSGRTIERFNGFERFVHWLTAVTFIVLAISGLNISFGKFVLLPLIGPEAFTTVSTVLKYAHNFLSFPFIVGVLLMLLIWAADNIPVAADREWLAAGGGLFGHEHPPSKRFNAGQKLLFWSVVLGGIALSVTGVMMLFPFAFSGMGGMQLATMIHGIVGVMLIGIIIGHIYIGSIGMEGAFDAMGSGKVDLNWAEHHHSLWVQEEMAKGRIAQPPRGAQAAE